MSPFVYGTNHSFGLLDSQARRAAFNDDLKWIDSRFSNLATLVMLWFPGMVLWLKKFRLWPKSMDGFIPEHSAVHKMGTEVLQSTGQHNTDLEKSPVDSHIARLCTHYKVHGKSESIPDESYILSDCLDHFTAGITTTADTLNAAVYWLSRQDHVHHQDRLREELHAAGIEPMSSSSVAQAKGVEYLEYVIKETLRRNPAIPESLERKVPANGHIELQGTTLHAGMEISAQPYSLHRHSIFKEAEAWNPERWDIPRDSETYVHMRRQLFAFGSGPRMCIGMNVAMSQLRLTLARIYSTYRTSLTTSWYDDKGAVIEFEAKKNAAMKDVAKGLTPDLPVRFTRLST